MVLSRVSSPALLCYSLFDMSMISDPFVYFEDRSIDTGHGWRDLDFGSLKFSLRDKDSELEVFDESGYKRWFASLSHFWITRLSSFEETGVFAYDELRTQDIMQVIPNFRGIDNMEGHFEFSMSPEYSRFYLNSQGFLDGHELQMKLARKVFNIIESHLNVERTFDEIVLYVLKNHGRLWPEGDDKRVTKRNEYEELSNWSVADDARLRELLKFLCDLDFLEIKGPSRSKTYIKT